MKKIFGVFLTFFSFSVFAADTDYAENLSKNGAGYCGKAINSIANWVLGESGQALSTWHAAKPKEHGVAVLIGKHYKDGSPILTITAVPVADGGCDASFTYVLPVSKSCSSLRDTTFKEWKYAGELQGTALYDDPTTVNVNVALQSFSDMCVVTKTGILFYDKSDLK